MHPASRQRLGRMVGILSLGIALAPLTARAADPTVTYSVPVAPLGYGVTSTGDVGQCFPAPLPIPGGSTRLTSFTLYMIANSLTDAQPMRAAVMQFDRTTSHTVGPVLYLSDIRSVPHFSAPYYQPFTFTPVGGLALVGGADYIVMIDQHINATSSNLDVKCTSDTSPDLFPLGELRTVSFAENPPYSLSTFSPLGSRPTTDLAFDMTFVIPEPALSLTVACASGLLLQRRPR